MKYFFKIKTKKALLRFNKYCQRHKWISASSAKSHIQVDYHTFKTGDIWMAVSVEKPNLKVWDDIQIRKIY